MSARNSDGVPVSDRELALTRVFDAPRELVFKAFTDPKHVIHWWGPNGFTNTIREMDVRPGGVWRFVMHGPDGVDYKNLIEYTEVVKPERLAWAHGEDDGGPPSFHATATFTEEGGKTRVILTLIFATAEERDRTVKESGAIEGGNQTLAKLAAYLETMK